MNNPIIFQRIENAAIFAAATYVYFDSHFSWLAYILLLFSFDVFMLGYLANSRVGGYIYNLGHSYTIPSLVVIGYFVHHSDFVLGLACLWFAHIGFDRALGYGLKLSSGFQNTHLGKIGK